MWPNAQGRIHMEHETQSDNMPKVALAAAGCHRHHREFAESDVQLKTTCDCFKHAHGSMGHTLSGAPIKARSRMLCVGAALGESGPAHTMLGASHAPALCGLLSPRQA